MSDPVADIRDPLTMQQEFGAILNTGGVAQKGSGQPIVKIGVRVEFPAAAW